MGSSLFHGRWKGDGVFVLNAGGRLEGFSVDEQLASFCRNCLTRQSDASLHVVLCFVQGTRSDAKAFFKGGSGLGFVGSRVVDVGFHIATSPLYGLHTQNGVVIVSSPLRIDHNGVAVWEIEYHRVVALHLANTRKPFVRKGKPLRVAWGHGTGQSIVYERHGNRRLRHFRAVTGLAHVEVVTDQHAAFHRTRWNHKGLKKKGSNHGGHHQRPQNALAPFATS